jgi:cytochrome P450
MPAAWHPFDVDSSAVYETLHREGGWHWSELLQSWVVSDFTTAALILKDHNRFASDPRRAGIAVPQAALNLQLLDPPIFNSLHGVIVGLLRPSTEHMGLDVSRRVLDDHFHGLGTQEQFDGMRDLSVPLAVSYMNEILGITSFDHSDLPELARIITSGMDSMFLPEHDLPARSARRVLSEVIAGWIERSAADSPLRRSAEAARAAGVDDQTFTNSLRAIVLSAYTSLPAAISAVLFEGATRRADYRSWAHEGFLAAGREEILRLHPPFQATSRFVTGDTVLAGGVITRGEPITVLIKAANLDPTKYRDPYALDVSRNEGRSLSFGYGVHACAGATLASALCELLMDYLARNNVTLSMVDTPTYAQHATVRMFDSLPLMASV